jgi:hypothetical protein
LVGNSARRKEHAFHSEFKIPNLQWPAARSPGGSGEWLKFFCRFANPQLLPRVGSIVDSRRKSSFSIMLKVGRRCDPVPLPEKNLGGLKKELESVPIMKKIYKRPATTMGKKPNGKLDQYQCAGGLFGL